MWAVMFMQNSHHIYLLTPSYWHGKSQFSLYWSSYNLAEIGHVSQVAAAPLDWDICPTLQRIFYVKMFFTWRLSSPALLQKDRHPTPKREPGPWHCSSMQSSTSPQPFSTWVSPQPFSTWVTDFSWETCHRVILFPMVCMCVRQMLWLLLLHVRLRVLILANTYGIQICLTFSHLGNLLLFCLRLNPSSQSVVPVLLRLNYSWAVQR